MCPIETNIEESQSECQLSQIESQNDSTLHTLNGEVLEDQGDVLDMEVINEGDGTYEVMTSDCVSDEECVLPSESGAVDKWNGFKIVCDNVDKNYRRTYQRLDYQTISRHYIHSFATLDRVDLSRFSDVPPQLKEIDCSLMLPSKEDNNSIKKIFSILVSRLFIINVNCYLLF